MVDDAPGRAPIETLQPETELLHHAEHLKALHLRLAERERAHEALRDGLMRQIRVFTDLCAETSAATPRCAEMWTQVKRELQAHFKAACQI